MEMFPIYNIIKVSNNSTYYSGEEKQINIINNFPKNKLNYDWYVFVDNDSFVNTKKIYEIIENFIPDHVYGSTCNCWPGDKNLHYCLGGAGIFISNLVLKRIIGKLTHNPVPWGDLSLGINLKRLNINMINDDRLHSQPPSFYKINDEDIKNNATFHYIYTFDEMEKLKKLS